MVNYCHILFRYQWPKISTCNVEPFRSLKKYLKIPQNFGHCTQQQKMQTLIFGKKKGMTRMLRTESINKCYYMSFMEERERNQVLLLMSRVLAQVYTFS